MQFNVGDCVKVRGIKGISDEGIVVSSDGDHSRVLISTTVFRFPNTRLKLSEDAARLNKALVEHLKAHPGIG